MAKHETSFTLKTERDALVFMAGLAAGRIPGLDGRIDPEEKQTILIDGHTDGAIDGWTEVARDFRVKEPEEVALTEPSTWYAIRESKRNTCGGKWSISTEPKGGPTWICEIVGSQPMPSEQTEEQVARLIASSPELLNACRKVVAAFDAGVFVRDTSRDSDSGWAIRAFPHIAALAEMVNAISKATGPV